MSEIIKISSEVIGTEKVNSVNARELHQVLGIERQFINWIDYQINSLGLEKNVDYIVYEVKGNGRPQKEYIITTDTAKHISMASRTAKGKEVRNYFIQIEKEYLNPNIHELNGRVGGLARANQMYRERILFLEDILKTQKEIPSFYTAEYFREDMTLSQKIEFILKQTEDELKKDTSRNDFFQNRANYLSNYIRVMKAGGNELQKFCIGLIEESQKARNEAYDKFVKKDAKLNNLLKQIEECCEKLTA